MGARSDVTIVLQYGAARLYYDRMRNLLAALTVALAACGGTPAPTAAMPPDVDGGSADTLPVAAPDLMPAPAPADLAQAPSADLLQPPAADLAPVAAPADLAQPPACGNIGQGCCADGVSAPCIVGAMCVYGNGPTCGANGPSRCVSAYTGAGPRNCGGYLQPCCDEADGNGYCKQITASTGQIVPKCGFANGSSNTCTICK